MTSQAYLEAYPARIDDLINRTKKALESVPVERWNAAIPEWHWTLAQILEHVHMSNRLYTPQLEEVGKNPLAGNSDFKLGLFGRMIVKNAGPNGNAPAPKAMTPAAGPYDATVLERFEMDLRRLQDFAAQLKGKDMALNKVRNPLIGFLKMSLFDAFEIAAVHTERHVQQIERFSKMV